MISEVSQRLLSGVLEIVHSLFSTGVGMLVKKGSGPFGIDTSIEGMNSQEFSVGIFYFLIVSIAVFTVFAFMFMLKSKADLKTGEKVLFAWIFFGIVMAVVFGAAQMLDGYLF